MKVKAFPATNEIVLTASTRETAIIVNALEEASMKYKEGSQIQLDADSMILSITQVTGY